MATHAFRFDPAFRAPLALLGVRPSTARVVVGEEELDARFGPWRLRTPLANVRDVQVSGPYSALKAIGPRASFADRGVTFGSSTAGGACVRFHEPVGALVGPLVRHPGLTVTVADPEALVADLATHGVEDVTEPGR